MRTVESVISSRRARAGFATATVLGLLAIVGLLSAGALHDALFGEQLAGSRLLHQRAMALADFGTADGLARIAGMATPETRSYALRPLPSSTDSVEVTLRHVGTSALPDGFSTGRLVLHRFEIESIGHTARGIRAAQVQGAVRMMPEVPPPGARATP
jgi:Tfp pilus assembly protein PilX